MSNNVARDNRKVVLLSNKTDKRDLRKLSRKELLEVLVTVSKENERLQAIVADLNLQLEQATAKPVTTSQNSHDDPELDARLEALRESAEAYLARVKEQADALLKNAQKEAETISANAPAAPEPEPEPEPTATTAAPEPEPESERGCERSG